jgi:hypothetical protein
LTIDTLDSVELDWRRPTSGSSNYMYGVRSLVDGPCAMDYDPWVHAEDLGIPVVMNDTMPRPQMVACFSSRRNAIFVRPNLHHAVERCAIAHEIVHFEYNDIGTTRRQEDRADRIAAQRLVRPSRLEEIGALSDDPGRLALELDVTERIMSVYMMSHG